MKYSQHLQNMAYLQNLNDKDNAVQMQYCQYQYLINKDNAVEMQLMKFCVTEKKKYGKFLQ